MRFKSRGIGLGTAIILFFLLLSSATERKKLLVSAGLLFSTAVVWFHRDPSRTPNSSGYVSPVDGKIQKISQNDDKFVLSVYLGIKDVHSVKSIKDGIVDTIERSSGENFPAILKNISEKNESLRFSYSNGDSVTVYVGFLARRLINYVDEKDRIRRGEEIGFISFGSRAKIEICRDNIQEDLNVEEGDYVRAGKTIITKGQGTNPQTVRVDQR